MKKILSMIIMLCIAAAFSAPVFAGPYFGMLMDKDKSEAIMVGYKFADSIMAVEAMRADDTNSLTAYAYKDVGNFTVQAGLGGNADREWHAAVGAGYSVINHVSIITRASWAEESKKFDRGKIYAGIAVGF